MGTYHYQYSIVIIGVSGYFPKGECEGVWVSTETDRQSILCNNRFASILLAAGRPTDKT